MTDLFNAADAQMENNVYSGVITQTYSVSGESTLRVYKVTWSMNGEGQIEQIWSRTQ